MKRGAAFPASVPKKRGRPAKKDTLTAETTPKKSCVEPTPTVIFVILNLYYLVFQKILSKYVNYLKYVIILNKIRIHYH